MLKEVLLSEGQYNDYQFPGKPLSLTQLGKINIFIGANNSGKSRFMRALFADDKFSFGLHEGNFETIVQEINRGIEFLKQEFDKVHVSEVNEVLSTLFALPRNTALFSPGTARQTIDKIREAATYLAHMTIIASQSLKAHIISGGLRSQLIPDIVDTGNRLLQLVNENFPPEFDYPLHKIYIPILRGLRPVQLDGNRRFSGNTDDNYYYRTLNDYFPGIKDEWRDRIFTGLHLYEEIKRMLLGNKKGRDRVKQFEDFLSVTFFDHKPVALIPDMDRDVLLITIGKGERHIFEYGDGIQSLIVLLYPLFLHNDKNLLVFIEEPEMSLHPGFQRLFLETLLKPEFAHIQFFITTHSNHFLDMTLDVTEISIFTFQLSAKNDKSVTTIQNTSNADIRILDLIGVRNSSVFLSNCTIWVEGITDRILLKKYLTIMQDSRIAAGTLAAPFLEDIHFSFIEYSGNNITHWSFDHASTWEQIQTSRISAKFFVIADQDNTNENNTSAKAQRHRVLKEKLGDQFQVLDAREIENTLSPSVLIKTIEELHTGTIPLSYDPQKIQLIKYQHQKLGTFIDKHFVDLSRKFEAKSGTIASKLEFSKEAINHMHTIEDLSAEAKRISNLILDFITKSNMNIS